MVKKAQINPKTVKNQVKRLKKKAKLAKNGLKNNNNNTESTVVDTEAIDSNKISTEANEKFRKKWKNRQRCLLLSSRGVSYLARHVLDNLRSLMPHGRNDNKFDNKKGLAELNEICEIKNCNKLIYFEMHNKQDVYMWLNALPHGPSVKFHLENLHTLEELKLTGNSLRHSRPLLSFTSDFDQKPHLKLIKELLTQTFGTPNYHPKSQPFIDHIFNFAIVDNRIWFRNYQIVDEDGTLAEIGPR